MTIILNICSITFAAFFIVTGWILGAQMTAEWAEKRFGAFPATLILCLAALSFLALITFILAGVVA